MKKNKGKQGAARPWLWLCLFFAGVGCFFAFAPQAARAQFSQVVQGQSGKSPVLFSADQLGYDKTNALVIARGHVELVQGETIVLADNVTYAQNTNEVFAAGNVSLRQSDGSVMFADRLRLKDDLQAGIIREFRARLSDNSLFAAREARKFGPDVTELDYAVYSPCKLCEEEDPLWQLKAEKVRIDNQKQRVTYEDAMLELWGFPVLWTPYFSHATPDADAKSGLLTPEWRASEELGTTVKIPYFVSFASNMDATITPHLNTKEAPMVASEFRYLNEAGYAQFRGSITNPKRRDEFGDEVSGREVRGHVDATGNFNIDPMWDWGFAARRATDDTYLRRYDINQEDLLTSRLFAEGIEGRTFASVQGLAFQRLTDEANPDSSPVILPMADVEWQSAPGWMGSRYNFDANTLILARSRGPQSRRVSLGGGWGVPMVLPGGQLLEASVNLRGDAYSVADVPQPNGAADFDGAFARLFPEAALHWSYPLINEYAPGQSLLIEPVVSAILSPSDLSSGKIPNEDSQVLEFSDTNVFDDNRYPGYDLVETGPRVNYGVQGQWEFDTADYFNFLLGQNFRTSDDNAFPFSNNPTDNFSDYVGRFGLDLDEWLSAAYRFRFDQAELASRRHEFNTSFLFDPVFLHLDYLDLNEDPFLGDRQEIFSSGSFKITDEWSFLAGARRDLEQEKMIDVNAGFRYQDECMTLFANFARSFISDRDVEPGTSFVLKVELKNLE